MNKISYDRRIFSEVANVPFDYEFFDFVMEDFFSSCDKDFVLNEYQNFRDAVDNHRRTTCRYIPLSKTNTSSYFVFEAKNQTGQFNETISLMTKEAILQKYYQNYEKEHKELYLKALSYLYEFSKFYYEIDRSIFRMYQNAIKQRKMVLPSFLKPNWIGYYFLYCNENVRNLIFDKDGNFQNGVNQQIFVNIESIFGSIAASIQSNVETLSSQYSNATHYLSVQATIQKQTIRANLSAEDKARIEELRKKCVQKLSDSNLPKSKIDEIRTTFTKFAQHPTPDLPKI